MRIVAGLAIVASLTLVSGCLLRIAGPDPESQTPSAAELVRQREALRSAAFSDGAAHLSADVPTVERISGHATRQLEALGGVWVPWPEGGGPPEAAETAVPVPDVGPFADVAGLVAALAVTVPELCVESVVAQAEPEVVLYASMCVARVLDWELLAAASGTAGPVFPELPSELRTTDPVLIMTLDAAAWASDVHAATAHAAGDAGWAAMEERAHQYRRLARGATVANGWAGTGEDPRRADYDVSSLADSGAIGAAISRAALGAMVGSADRQAMLELALFGGIEAQRGGVDLGPLPGIE